MRIKYFDINENVSSKPGEWINRLCPLSRNIELSIKVDLPELLCYHCCWRVDRIDR